MKQPWRSVVMIVVGGAFAPLGAAMSLTQGEPLMLSPDSSLWESRRATGLFWASVAGVLLFLVGGVVALVVSARSDLRNRE